MRLGLTLLYVEDFPRLLAFYRDTLGLPPDLRGCLRLASRP
jgi:catechol 2,3-dioxygenase-like lactoylglutathione lyase family enzyme